MLFFNHIQSTFFNGFKVRKVVKKMGILNSTFFNIFNRASKFLQKYQQLNDDTDRTNNNNTEQPIKSGIVPCCKERNGSIESKFWYLTREKVLMFNLNQSSKAAAYSTNNIFDNLDANPSDEIDASYFFFLLLLRLRLHSTIITIQVIMI